MSRVLKDTMHHSPSILTKSESQVCSAVRATLVLALPGICIGRVVAGFIEAVGVGYGGWSLASAAKSQSNFTCIVQGQTYISLKELAQWAEVVAVVREAL